MSEAHRPTPEFFAAAYRTHRFCNPLSEAVLERALEVIPLRPGLRAADLGCGNAAMALHLAERHGLQVDAVERSPGMLALARRRLEGSKGVRLHAGEAEALLAASEPFDLIVATGAHALFAAAPDLAGVFLRLRAHARPGGHILFGDAFFRKPPSERLAAALSHFGTHRGYVAAGEAAGLTPLIAVESPQLDFDDYAWRMERSVRAYVAEHPEDPDAGALMARARMQREAYLAEARDVLGFGLYVFETPAA